MDFLTSAARTVATAVVTQGPVPTHIAFIMDGNRRFARKAELPTAEGHAKGFSSLLDACEWSMQFGVRFVTVYAFSIENFKRSAEEVNALMGLALEKFEALLEEWTWLDENQIGIRILGDLARLPLALQQRSAQVMLATRSHERLVLNICLSYTSTDEMTQAVNAIAAGVADGALDVGDINEDLISTCLFTRDSPPPDILIRTSGEIRLSNFLLWQSGFSQLTFLDVLWPELRFWHLMRAIVEYQRNHAEIVASQERYYEQLEARSRIDRERGDGDGDGDDDDDDDDDDVARDRRRLAFAVAIDDAAWAHLEALAEMGPQDLADAGASSPGDDE